MATKKTKKKTAVKKTATKKKVETTVKKELKSKEPTILGLPQTPALLLLIVIAFAGGIYISNQTDGGDATGDGGDIKTGTVGSTGGSQYGTVKLNFYVMSMCPYGTQVLDAIKPVLDKLGDAVDFKLNFIATDQGDGTFQSLHGQAEVDENIRQLCANKYNPDKYMDYIVCRNKDISSTDWETCANQAGLDTAKVKQCVEGDEGATLHSESIVNSNAANAQGSPTMYLAGQLYGGGRDSLSFQRALCQHLEGHPECMGLPACGQDTDCTAEQGKIGKCENPGEENAKCVYSDPVEFEIVVLNDKDCGAACDTTALKQVLEQLFIGASFRDVDVSTDEGKKLIEDYELTVAPAYIFEPKVTTTYSWINNPRIVSAFERKGDSYKLSDEATGATWFVSEEAKNKYSEAIGLTLGDNKPQIDFFVMSYCPYGNQAEEIVAQVYDILGDSVEYIPRYVVYENYGGGGTDYCLDEGKLCSMHGIQEINQDIRELCVYNDLGIGKYFEFVMEMNAKCNSGNADTCWTNVASGLKLDTEKIAACETEQGVELMRSERELNVLLRVSGSPTIFIEGEQYAGARSATGFASALCAKFDSKPDACDDLPEDAAVPVAAAQGSC